MFRMKRSSTGRGEGKGNVSSSDDGAVEWEVRPGGMLVQKREDGSSPAGPLIKVRVSFGTFQHEVTVPAHSTFGELKSVLVPETGLQPHEQRVLFRGKEKENEDYLHMVGVKDMSKVILLEDPASKEQKLEEMRKNKDKGISKAQEAVSAVREEIDKLGGKNKNKGMSKAQEALSAVREEVNKLGGKVSALETEVYCGTKVADKEFVVLTELLMMQLLKLDAIEAEGEDKVQRKTEVCRVQSFVDTIDSLKTKNFKPFADDSTDVTMTTQWETFGSEMENLDATPQPPESPTKITNNWWKKISTEIKYQSFEYYIYTTQWRDRT